MSSMSARLSRHGTVSGASAAGSRWISRVQPRPLAHRCGSSVSIGMTCAASAEPFPGSPAGFLGDCMSSASPSRTAWPIGFSGREAGGAAFVGEVRSGCGCSSCSGSVSGGAHVGVGPVQVGVRASSFSSAGRAKPKSAAQQPRVHPPRAGRRSSRVRTGAAEPSASAGHFDIRSRETELGCQAASMDHAEIAPDRGGPRSQNDGGVGGLEVSLRGAAVPHAVIDGDSWGRCIPLRKEIPHRARRSLKAI
ncbi:hypothetical protein SANTM175S_03468 [Streptomyces antimycoticus]